MDEHGLAELFDQVLDLGGVKSGPSLSWCQYGLALFVLRKATDIFKVVLKIVHRLRKCGVLLYR